MKRKTFELKDFDIQVSNGRREVVSVISTDAIDRDKEVVLPQGLKRKNYAGNPVVLLDHQMTVSHIVGKCLWLKRDGNRIVSKTYITDKTQTGRDVFGLLQDGILTTVSIGYIPLKESAPQEKEIVKRPELAGVRNMVREWELLEYSFVAVPANPEALTLAVSKNYSPETLQLINGGKMPSADELILPDCWEWKSNENEGEDDGSEISLPEMATPQFIRPLSQLERQLDNMTDRLQSEKFINRYLGKV